MNHYTFSDPTSAEHAVIIISMIIYINAILTSAWVSDDLDPGGSRSVNKTAVLNVYLLHTHNCRNNVRPIHTSLSFNRK